MKKRQRIHRLYHLHEQILRRFEQEQQVVAERVSVEEASLQLISESQSEAEAALQGDRLAWEALAWNQYLALLEQRAVEQTEVLQTWYGYLEESRERTLSAFQDSKRWEMLSEHALDEYKAVQSALELRSADELAVTRSVIGRDEHVASTTPSAR